MEDKSPTDANKSDQNLETKCIFAVFKAKVEEAIRLVDKIPSEQKAEVWQFWDLVSKTIQKLTQTCAEVSVTSEKERKNISKCANKLKKQNNTQKKNQRGKRTAKTKSSSKQQALDRIQSESRDNKDCTTNISEGEVVVETVQDKNKLNLDEIVIHSLDFSDLISFPGSAQSDIHYHDSQATPDIIMSKEDNHMNTPNHMPDEDHGHDQLSNSNPGEVGKSEVGKREGGDQHLQVVAVQNVESKDLKLRDVEEKENTSPSEEKKCNTKKSPYQESKSDNSSSIGNVKDLDGVSDEKNTDNACKRTQRKRKVRKDESYVYERPSCNKNQVENVTEVDNEDRDDGDGDDDSIETLLCEDIKPKKRRKRLNKNDTDRLELTCCICQSQLSSVAALEVHMRKHTGDRPFACKQCGKSFTTNGNLQRHERSHIGDRPFQCDVCKKTFTESKSLKVHMRSHTGERPFKCQYCDKSFTQSGVLQSHVALHTGVKKHLCDLCGKEFIQRSNLQIHVKRHQNNRQFKCQTCSMSFFTKTDLDRHSQKHTGYRPFLCSCCPKTFSRMQYLKEHMNQHLGNRPYSCKMCDKKFFDQPALHRHRKKHKLEEEKNMEARVIFQNSQQKDENGENFSANIDNESDTEETAVDHIIMTTDEVLSNETLQQLKAVISQEAERMQVQGDHEQMEIILTPDPSSVPSDTISKSSLGQKSTDLGQQEVYITINPSDFSPDNSSVVAAVDFSAINLLANATTGQISFS